MALRTTGLILVIVVTLLTLTAMAVGLVLALSGSGPGRGAGFDFSGARDQVAVIRIDGAIDDTLVEPVESLRRRQDNVLSQLRDAREDDRIRAVVLRINSPGGSVAASETLYREIRAIRETKPVVAHFVDIAASGGYYIASAATEIVTQPGAITGSIGVILISLDTQELFEKVGIRERTFKTGPYKDILSSNRDVTPEEERIIGLLLDQALDQFVLAVAEGRGLQEAEVRRIADGRIVSGTEAVRLRLADSTGDERTAILRAARLAGIEGEPRVSYYPDPRPLSGFGLLGRAAGVWLGQVGQAVTAPGPSLRYEWGR